MGKRGRQAFRHNLHIHNAEQLALIQGDVAHQVTTLSLDAALVALAVVRVVELGDRQRDDHLHVARRDAGQQQGVVNGQQVEIVILIVNVGRG